jgi:hypothetical protein
MKNKLLILWFCFFYIGSTLIAQKKSDTPDMIFWNGGNVSYKVNLGLNSSVGAGSGSGILGGMISPNLHFGSAVIFSNPAELAYLKKTNLNIETKLGIGITNLLSQSNLTSTTDEILKDTSSFIFKTGAYRRDTKPGTQDLSQSSNLPSFTAATSFNNSFTIGVGFSRPIDLSFDFFVNGLSTSLNTVKKVGDNETKIDIIFKPTIQTSLKLKASRVSFALAKEINIGENNKLAFGLSATHYYVQNYFNVNMDLTGEVILNNQSEYFFNDPNDVNIDPRKDESNKLLYKLYGDFHDNKTGFTIGTNFQNVNPESWLSNFNFSIVANINPNFDLVDKDAYIESYQPKFMKGKLTGKDDDKFDIIVDSLDISKPNLTKATNNYFSDRINIKLPSSITFGVDSKLGVHNLSLNISKYFGDLSYQFDRYTIGKKLDLGVKFGMDFKFPEKLKGWSFALIPIRILYLDIDGLLMQLLGNYTKYSNPHYRFYAGANFGNSIVEGISDKDSEKSFNDMLSLPIPAEFSLIRQYTILDNVNIAVMVFGFPDMFFRFSAGIAM